jgi:hypothetical protein
MASSSESTYTIIVLTDPLLHEHDTAGSWRRPWETFVEETGERPGHHLLPSRRVRIQIQPSALLASRSVDQGLDGADSSGVWGPAVSSVSGSLEASRGGERVQRGLARHHPACPASAGRVKRLRHEGHPGSTCASGLGDHEDEDREPDCIE